MKSDLTLYYFGFVLEQFGLSTKQAMYIENCVEEYTALKVEEAKDGWWKEFLERYSNLEKEKP